MLHYRTALSIRSAADDAEGAKQRSKQFVIHLQGVFQFL
jgi:hypothetical protein